MLNWGREAMQEAWNIANDSLRTALCVRYRAQVVACGILFLAARRLKVGLGSGPLFGLQGRAAAEASGAGAVGPEQAGTDCVRGGNALMG